MEVQGGMPDREQAADFLRSLVNKNLRVTTTDSRMFWGQFKCTDPVRDFISELSTDLFADGSPQDSNVVLAHTYEYRQPSVQKRVEAAAQTADAGTVRMDMTSRYLGLVVVPGKYIVKMEVEEFASQMRQSAMQSEMVL
jgi:hypothetical protein